MTKILTIADAGGLETLVAPFAIPALGLINGKIVVSVASNNITVAIKGRNGNDPSTSNPVFVVINSSVRAIAAALYITLNAGTNWFNAGSAELATLSIDYFPMLAWVSASSEVAIGFARISSGSLGSDFHATSTNEKYAAWKKGSNSAVTVAATDEIQVIGRFAAILSASASYNWSIPTHTIKNLKQIPTFESRLLSYTPVFTNLTVGNGTLVARYFLTEQYIYIEIDLIFGSTTSISGAVSFTLPFTNVSVGQAHPQGQASLLDNGTGTTFGNLEYFTSTTMRIRAVNASSTYAAMSALSATVPFTWATGDEISVSGKYIY